MNFYCFVVILTDSRDCGHFRIPSHDFYIRFLRFTMLSRFILVFAIDYCAMIGY